MLGPVELRGTRSSSIWDGAFKSTLEIVYLLSLGGNACYDSSNHHADRTGHLFKLIDDAGRNRLRALPYAGTPPPPQISLDDLV